MGDYAKEKWVSLYQSALSESEHTLVARRLVEARAEIVNRLAKLGDMPGLHNAERHAIDEALRNLCVLEREDVKRTAERRKAAQKASKAS